MKLLFKFLMWVLPYLPKKWQAYILSKAMEGAIKQKTGVDIPFKIKLP